MRLMNVNGALGALVAALTIFGGATPGSADVPKGAIGAIAVSPDGATVVASGNPRTFYVLDADTLEVKDRVWHGYNPLRLYWTKDGSRLALYHTDDIVTFFDAASLKEVGKTEKFNAHCFAAGAGKLITMHSGSKKDEKYPITLTVYSLATGEKTASTVLSYTVPVGDIACSPDGAQIAIASKQYDTDTEEKKNPPKDMAREDQPEFKKRNDAKAMWIGWFDGDLNKGAEYESWFSDSGASLFFIKDGKALWFDNSTENVAFQADGTIEMKKLDNAGSFYGGLAGADHSFFLSGTLGKGYKVETATLSETEFKFPDRLEGWPEYLYGFAVAPDGTIYGGTSAYRMMKISPDGKVLDMKPVH